MSPPLLLSSKDDDEDTDFEMEIGEKSTLMMNRKRLKSANVPL
jgi:hypothetical protein